MPMGDGVLRQHSPLPTQPLIGRRVAWMMGYHNYPRYTG